MLYSLTNIEFQSIEKVVILPSTYKEVFKYLLLITKYYSYQQTNQLSFEIYIYLVYTYWLYQLWLFPISIMVAINHTIKDSIKSLLSLIVLVCYISKLLFTILFTWLKTSIYFIDICNLTKTVLVNSHNYTSIFGLAVGNIDLQKYK